MSIVEEIDGRRIAKDVEARAKALEVLDRPRNNELSLWLGVIGMLAMGVFLGVLAQHDALLIGSLAGVGYGFGTALFGEVVQLRRRLNAVITLLRLGQRPPE